jgi:predicted nucleic-acid-binding Zn-ribbon protein
MSLPATCPHCNGASLYTQRLTSGGGHGPYFLKGLGSFLHMAEFDVVVCADCGLTQFFAEPDARKKVSVSTGWQRVGHSPFGGTPARPCERAKGNGDSQRDSSF